MGETLKCDETKGEKKRSRCTGYPGRSRQKVGPSLRQNPEQLKNKGALPFQKGKDAL